MVMLNVGAPKVSKRSWRARCRSQYHLVGQPRRTPTELCRPPAMRSDEPPAQDHHCVACFGAATEAMTRPPPRRRHVGRQMCRDQRLRHRDPVEELPVSAVQAVENSRQNFCTDAASVSFPGGVDPATPPSRSEHAQHRSRCWRPRLTSRVTTTLTSIFVNVERRPDDVVLLDRLSPGASPTSYACTAVVGSMMRPGTIDQERIAPHVDLQGASSRAKRSSAVIETISSIASDRRNSAPAGRPMPGRRGWLASTRLAANSSAPPRRRDTSSKSVSATERPVDVALQRCRRCSPERGTIVVACAPAAAFWSILLMVLPTV